MSVPLRILIVEDEWLIAEDHAERLKEAGCRIVGPAPSVKAALEFVAREKVDCALLDVQLKGETSHAVADALRERAIPFAFVTGFGGDEIPSRFAGVEVLQKPASTWELTGIVAALTSMNVTQRDPDLGPNI